MFCYIYNNMKSITDITRALVEKDELLYEAMRQDILNLRAVGRQIRPKIERFKMEKVGLETIVVSLSRIQNEIIAQPPIKPTVKLVDMTLQTPLSTITYPKASLSKEKLTLIRQIIDKNTAKFCTMTEGFKEVTMILPAQLASEVLDNVYSKPSMIKANLYAISLHFDPRYIKEANVLYSILGELAIHRINLIEIISTATELSLLVESRDVQKVTESLNRLINQS